MFEEDFDRCFMCQQPSKGLYCSSECRLQDKGTVSPAVKATHGPIRLTANLPMLVSPGVRPVPGRSPMLRGARAGTSSSASSSTSESPIQSPRTTPSSASSSPQKHTFNLPPPAYPGVPFGSVPVKIPNLAPRPTVAPATGPHSHTHAAALPAGSIDTLRFGRKSATTNSVTSPNALAPRCACGKALNHRGRPSSRERAAADGLDSAFARFSLGPSATATAPDAPHRIVSEPVHRTVSGSPAFLPLDHAISGGSLLSRSRSDPIPPSPKFTRPLVAPSPLHISSALPPTPEVASRTTPPRARRTSPVNADADSPLASPRRGRSRDRPTDRPNHLVEMTPGLLLHHEERELAPSRSRHRRDELERERERSREGRSRDRSRSRRRSTSRGRDDRDCDANMGRAGRDREIQALGQARFEPPPITPSWSRPAPGAPIGVVPMRRGPSGGAAALPPITSSKPPSPTEQAARGTRSPKSPSDRERDEDKAEQLRRASEQLGHVFGVA
ncbi:hypothetical protein Q5752_005483 [Cryptotrichosporon argae]